MEREAFAGWLGIALALFSLLGILWKLLLPRIVGEMATQLAEIKRLVGENHHSNPERPTVPDRIADHTALILSRIDGISGRIDGLERRLEASELAHTTVHRDIWSRLNTKMDKG